MSRGDLSPLEVYEGSQMALKLSPSSEELKALGNPNDFDSFREMTNVEKRKQLRQDLNKLLETAKSEEKPNIEKEFASFEQLFTRFLQDVGPSLDWEKIEPLQDGAVIDYKSLHEPKPENVKAMLNKLVVIKLNGGLGTTMGCTGPKSIIPVRSDYTFLDLTVQQIESLNRTYGVDVPLVLMNSFNTNEDTHKIIHKYKEFDVNILTFNQSKFPRLNRESFTPITTSVTGPDHEAWYPPGHGDLYESFYNSGLLETLIKQGREYCFVSNIDNLGATVDINILKLLLNPANGKSPDFVMELTDKTRADVKGGTLIQYEGKLRLLEIAQVPKEHIDDFKSVKKFKIFNTNNLWIRLSAIKQLIDRKALEMEIIVNHKALDNGLNVIQLETASGAAMKNFDVPLGINVPRKRFLPVKKTSDLLLVMSNLYSLTSGSLVMSPKRSFPTVPLIKLGDHNFKKVRDFLKRFASIPDILELDHLTVSGDVTFGKNVVLKGTVIIIANHGDRIDIPSGAIMENKIVSGNLRILDH